MSRSTGSHVELGCWSPLEPQVVGAAIVPRNPRHATCRLRVSALALPAYGCVTSPSARCSQCSGHSRDIMKSTAVAGPGSANPVPKATVAPHASSTAASAAHSAIRHLPLGRLLKSLETSAHYGNAQYSYHLQLPPTRLHELAQLSDDEWAKLNWSSSSKRNGALRHCDWHVVPQGESPASPQLSLLQGIPDSPDVAFASNIGCFFVEQREKWIIAMPGKHANADGAVVYIEVRS